MGSLPADVTALAARQDGCITVAQCSALGMSRARVARLARRGWWQRLHRGVYVVHAGPVPWRTRARAALLYAGAGAALSHRSSAYSRGISVRPPEMIEVSIPRARYVRPTRGVHLYRRPTPPPSFGRLRAVDEPNTVLDLVRSSRSTDEAVGVLCDAARARIAPQSVIEALARRRAFPRRRLVLDLLDVVAEGVESPLEHRYHRDVERRHGLPAARLQLRHRVDARWVRADRVYEGRGVRVELDGVLAHPGGRTDEDTWRDNAVLVERDEITLRYRWRHVQARPCAVATQVLAALRARGWTGEPRACGADCTLPLGH